MTQHCKLSTILWNIVTPDSNRDSRLIRWCSTNKAMQIKTFELIHEGLVPVLRLLMHIMFTAKLVPGC